MVRDCCVAYSAAIGYLCRNFDEYDKQDYAFNYAVVVAKHLKNKQVVEWLSLAKQMESEADFDKCLAGANYLVKQKYIDPLQNVGHLKHGFVLAFYFLLLFQKCAQEQVR